MTKVLVIEDEAILRDEIITWLTLEGYAAVGVGDGLEGLNEAFRDPPDLIVCDITMPQLDGYGVLLELRAAPSTAAIPFIFITARAAHDDIRKGMDLGADDYITKPFTRLELMGAIQSRLDKKSVFEHKHQHEITLLQQALEQEHERQMLKAKLVAMFSHDFRNPLATILSSNSLLRDYNHRMEPERQQKHFNRIEASVRQLIQMLDDMLIVAKMETGKLEFKPEVLNAEQFFQTIIDEFRIIHGDTRPIQYNRDFNGTIAADSRLLRQIATNLISNAIKYSPQGSEVCVGLRYLNGQMILTVQDHGIGIPDTDMKHVFESFQRAANVGSIKGTGLGLAIVKQAAELHGGTIQLESQVGMGTIVMVEIPICSA